MDVLYLQKLFCEFRAKVTDNANKLFVMVVDEAHHAAVRRGAHDAFANDHRCKTDDGTVKHGAHKTGYHDEPGEWSKYTNLLTLLVSATPACVLTADSRIPRQYYVPHDLTAEQKQLRGTGQLHRYSIIKDKASSEGIFPQSTTLEATSWTCEGHDVGVDDLKEYISNKVNSGIKDVCCLAVPHYHTRCGSTTSIASLDQQPCYVLADAN